MLKITIERAKEIFSSFQDKTIAVIGDVMLDRYFWGNVSRISPGAPVPVIDIRKETFHLGGAANVANNLKSIGINPLLCGVVGSDAPGGNFLDISRESGILVDGIFVDNSRPTTVKTRIIGNNQQIARLDKEVRNFVGSKSNNFILDTLRNFNDLSAIIFEDYNKGAVSPDLIRDVISFAKKNNIPIFVDPKFDNFFLYEGVTVFKPNRKEASQAMNMSIESNDEIIKCGLEIIERLKCDNVLLTLGKDGMMLIESSEQTYSVPTRARHVADVSGAGDTAIATLSASIAGNASIREAATLANFASGLVCEQPGIVSIKIDPLLDTIKRNNFVH